MHLLFLYCYFIFSSPSSISFFSPLGDNQVDGKNRAILVKFTSYRAKRAFMEKKQDLKECLYFNEDLTKFWSNLLFKARQVFKSG